MNDAAPVLARSVAMVTLVSVSFAAAALTFLAMAAPLNSGARVTSLVIFGGSAILSSATKTLHDVTSRLVGLSLLALALMPSFGAELRWMAVPVLVLGVASADIATLVRVVIAMPMVLISIVFNAGTAVPAVMLLGWSVCTAVMLISANQLAIVNAFRRFETETHRQSSTGLSYREASTVWRWCRRPASALAAILFIAPLAVGFGYSIDITIPQFAGSARIGDMAGNRIDGHPGLRGSLDVGDPVELSDDVVLKVKSDRSLYWRATTYENWNGRTWTSPDRVQTIDWPGRGVRPVDSGLPDAVVETETVTQSFRTVQAGFDVLLGAPEVDVVWAVADSAQISDNGSIWLGEPLGAQAEWTVESTVPIVDSDVLRQADEIGYDAVPDVFHYAFEDNVSTEVAELAREITEGAPTTYDKVRAIERWMDDNITYDRDIPSLPEGNDAVTELLFETKVGFCEQIGSALVVMLRSLGIPARLAVGYVPSGQDRETGEWISRGSDAHAWAEVYFPGVGWQGFDPTAGVPLSGERTTEPSSAVLWQSNVAIGGVTVVVVLLLFLLTVLGLRRLLGSANLVRERKLQQRFNKCGARLGYDWTQSMTLADRADDLVSSGLDSGLVLNVLTHLQDVHYSPPEARPDFSDAEHHLDLLERQCSKAEPVA